MNCPKLRKIKFGIITLLEMNELKDLIHLDNFKIAENSSEFTLSFRAFNLYSSKTNIFKIIYKHKPNEDDLLYLLYLIKYTKKELYEKKAIITDCIYKPFLCQDYVYDDFKLEKKGENLKGKLYCIEPLILENKSYYVIGGWDFGIYSQNDFSIRNILSNEFDDCVTALTIIKENNKHTMICGYKSGNVKLWEIFSLHDVKYLNTIFKKFCEVKKIFKILDNSKSYGIVDENKIKIWKNFGEEIFGIDVDKSKDVNKDINKIICLIYEYCEVTFENLIIYADKRSYLFFIKFKNVHLNFDAKKELKINKIKIDSKRQITSLKYYKKSNTLFYGNTKMICVFNCNNFTEDNLIFLNAQINYIDYYIYKKIMYLFCNGENNLHILHFKL